MMCWRMCKVLSTAAIISGPLCCARSVSSSADSGREDARTVSADATALDALFPSVDSDVDSQFDTSNDVDNCAAEGGRCGRVCMSTCMFPPNSSPACIEQRCDFVCEPGFARESAACVRTPLRLISPQSMAYTRSRRVSFTWTPVAGVDDYELTISDNSSMSSAVVVHLTMPHHVWTNSVFSTDTLFWRVRALRGGAEIDRSPNWVFRTEQLMPLPEAQSCHRRFFDPDGDGNDDLALPQGDGPTSWGVYQYRARDLVGPYRQSETRISTPDGLSAPIPVGDVDGNGVADLIVRGAINNTLVRFQTDGAPIVTSVLGGLYVITAQQLGDVNADGFADVLVSRMVAGRHNADTIAWGGPGSNALASMTNVVDPTANTEEVVPWSIELEPGAVPSIGISDTRGGGRWLRFEPQTRIPSSSGEYWGGGAIPVGDMNGDGFIDYLTPTLAICIGSALGPTTTLLPLPRPSGLLFRGSIEPGDINGDGLSDVIVLAAASTGSVSNELRFVVYFGSRTPTELPVDDRVFTVPGVSYFGVARFGIGARAKRFSLGHTQLVVNTANLTPSVQVFELDFAHGNTVAESRFDLPVPTTPASQPFLALWSRTLPHAARHTWLFSSSLSESK